MWWICGRSMHGNGRLPLGMFHQQNGRRLVYMYMHAHHHISCSVSYKPKEVSRMYTQKINNGTCIGGSPYGSQTFLKKGGQSGTNQIKRNAARVPVDVQYVRTRWHTILKSDGSIFLILFLGQQNQLYIDLAISTASGGRMSDYG